MDNSVRCIAFVFPGVCFNLQYQFVGKADNTLSCPGDGAGIYTSVIAAVGLFHRNKSVLDLEYIGMSLMRRNGPGYILIQRKRLDHFAVLPHNKGK